jgi:hypothetical protein
MSRRIAAALPSRSAPVAANADVVATVARRNGIEAR